MDTQRTRNFGRDWRYQMPDHGTTCQTRNFQHMDNCLSGTTFHPAISGGGPGQRIYRISCSTCEADPPVNRKMDTHRSRNFGRTGDTRCLIMELHVRQEIFNIWTTAYDPGNASIGYLVLPVKLIPQQTEKWIRREPEILAETGDTRCLIMELPVRQEIFNIWTTAYTTGRESCKVKSKSKLRRDAERMKIFKEQKAMSIFPCAELNTIELMDFFPTLNYDREFIDNVRLRHDRVHSERVKFEIKSVHYEKKFKDINQKHNSVVRNLEKLQKQGADDKIEMEKLRESITDLKEANLRIYDQRCEAIDQQYQLQRDKERMWNRITTLEDELDNIRKNTREDNYSNQNYRYRGRHNHRRNFRNNFR
ncbi:unnamed protein product [Mytilus edulis]|uniref:Uncharacterized protein n=1 Tax=Mytilus edulis TaxID=6550 RepID=A0A8S3TJW6_MYTED|nr:unnamed protein product [Mytilus edulis]